MEYVIREDTPISGMPGDLEKVHVVRPISTKKLKALLQKCPRLETIDAPSSVVKRLTTKAKKMVNARNISFIHTRKAGRAIGIDLDMIRMIADLKKDFLSLREISEKTGVPKSTIHYLLKKSKREKVRKGKHIIYV